MMIKVSNEFLEFDEQIEVEKQIKLFEDISTTDGDFSYSFELAKTLTNTRILQNPQPDNISKLVYQKIPAKLLSDSGAETYDGYIRIERITEVYHCSFFAGNNNWFGMLSGALQELNWSEYDIDQTEINIQSAIFNTSGVVFPVVDNGGLLTRGYQQLKVEDFVAGIYVKDVFNKVFSAHGIKIQGELLNDVNYQTAITIKNGRYQSEIDASSTFAQQSILQARPVELTEYTVLFDNDSVYPYFDGANNPYNPVTGIYTVPYKMRLKIEVELTPDIVDADYNQRIYLYLNGVYTFVDIGLAAGGLYNSATPGDSETFTFVRSIIFNEGDTILFKSQWQQSIGSTQNDVVGGTVKFTPEFIYKAFGAAIVPSWTQQKYVSNIFRLFNVLASYKEANKTLTLNIFEKIKSKPAIDLSEYISETEIDYTEFISAYGKKSLLSFGENEDEELKKRVQKLFSYEKGEIDVDNDFLNDSEDILESDFTFPIGYINSIFDMSIERLNLLSLSTGDSIEATTVTDSVGQARFAIPDDIFQLSDLVRVEESTNPIYNGDWMVENQAAGYVELKGLPFSTVATAKLTKLVFEYEESDAVFILHHVPLYTVSKFSGKTFFAVENTDISTLAIAFSNLLQTGRQVNIDFIYSLSFSGEGNPLHYQQTLIDQYFRLFGKMLNDPVKLFSVAHIPQYIYDQIDFLSPAKILTEETQNVYYMNKMSGYKSSDRPCVLELIKI
jgi:hypothetical protein